jgi:hypothetical protein
VAPVLRAAGVSAMAPVAQASHTAPTPAAPAVMPHAAHGYAVMAAAFPMLELSHQDGAASADLDSSIDALQAMGYRVRLMDVNLEERGDWRRVLVGEYATIDEARVEAERLHHTPAFVGAEAIKF